ncbi:MAG: ATP-binding cassette domain-containing protein [Myxococcota bacterium]
MSNTGTPLLELRGAGKRFGAIQALSGVDLVVRSGEVLALVGDNGAGKSTLIKCMAGSHPLDEGLLLVQGEPVHLRAPPDATRLGIETVYQDLALCDALDVVANLFLGRELLVPGAGRPLRMLDEVVMEQKAREVLAELAVTIPDLRAPVASLSGGQRQCIAVARAVMWNSRLVILDEPTAALGVAQAGQVLDLVRRLRARGLAVLIISHNLADVFAVADRIVVLRLGRKVADVDARAVSREDVVAAITGAAERA